MDPSRLPVYIVAGSPTSEVRTRAFFTDETFFDAVDTKDIISHCTADINHLLAIGKQSGVSSEKLLKTQTDGFDNLQIIASLKDADDKYNGRPVLIIKNGSEGRVSGKDLSSLIKASLSVANPVDLLYLCPWTSEKELKSFDTTPIDYKEIPGISVDRMFAVVGLRAVIYMPRAQKILLASRRTDEYKSLSDFIVSATNPDGPLVAKVLSKDIFYSPRPRVREVNTKAHDGTLLAILIIAVVLAIILAIGIIIYLMHRKTPSTSKNIHSISIQG